MLPKPFVAHEMRQPQRDIKNGFKELEEAGYINYDDQAEVILDRKALLDYKPNPNQIKGALAKIADLPPTHLKVEFLKVVYSIDGQKDLYEAMVGRFPELLPEAFENGLESLSQDFPKAREGARARQLERELENEGSDSKLVEIGSQGGRA